MIDDDEVRVSPTFHKSFIETAIRQRSAPSLTAAALSGGKHSLGTA